MLARVYKFLLDENIERRLALFLKRQGYDIKTIGYDYPKALRDKDILSIAVQENRILITSDYTDYYDLIFHRGLPHCGVIILRLNTLTLTAKEQRILEGIHEYAKDLKQPYLIVTPYDITVAS
jgi:predicted nuclease of predicted toxin-antitoxin system